MHFFQWRWIFNVIIIFKRNSSGPGGSTGRVLSTEAACRSRAKFINFWLAPIPRLILQTYSVRLMPLSIFERRDQYTIGSRYFHWLETRLTDGLFAWKKGSLGDGELNNCIHNYSKTKWLSSFWLKQKGRNARKCKLYCMVDVIYFLRVSARKKISVFILSSTVPKNRPKFWRKSRGSRLVKNLENFWKTIIEFDYRMMQRIMLISEAFTYPPWMIILLDLDNYPHHTQLYSTTWSGGTR